MTPPTSSNVLGVDDKITVTINGLRYEVPITFSEISLNQYIREYLQLTGTKVTCREGGCGVCTVHVAHPDPLNPQQMIQKSINSCLCPILTCDKWEITTVEGVGNQNHPHPIQSALVDHYGTQCGYCTPGWVMNMYSVLQNNPGGSLTQQDVENACDGNICRCTGYRPILDAFKTFASDHPNKCAIADIEDAVNKGLCKKTGKVCSGSCHGNSTPYIKALSSAAESLAPPWYRPTTLPELYQLIKTLGKQNVYYVVGHTGKGVYNDAPYDAYVDMKGIAELYGTTATADLLTVGANTTLTDLITAFKKQSTTPGFQHLASLAALISRTAHHSIRNSGSWGGNLAMKNRHKEFPSDSFVAFTVGGAKIILGSTSGVKSYTMQEFLTADLTGLIILKAEFPTFDADFVFRTFKIMPRSGNAHAYVNAGFRAKIDKKSHAGMVVITEAPVLTFGNINSHFVQADKTAAYLQGKNIADPAVLQQALNTLNTEIIPSEDDPSEASSSYKKSLSCSLFYKFALELVGDLADVRYRSAVGSLVRPLSSGKQSYPTKPENWPLTKPMPKLESTVQCTGEAKYSSDIQQEGMLHAAFTLTTMGNAAIYEIDIKPAMAFPGVTRVLIHSDIPGVNNVYRLDNDAEEVLASKRSLYAGQPIAIVIAISQDIAEKAAKLVKVSYFDVKTPILTCKDAIKSQSFYSAVPGVTVGDAAAAIASAANKIEGEIELGSQNHFHMETEGAVAYPTEDGLNLEDGSQWLDQTQASVAQVLGIGMNKINVTVKRSGGAFGGKGIHNYVICAAALSAYLVRRPVKMHLSLWDNLRIKGRRLAYYVKYRAGTDAAGKLVGIILDIYANMGCSNNDVLILLFAAGIWDNVYRSPNWKINVTACRTNCPASTFVRAPGSTEAVFFMENVMEHLAKTLQKPSLEIKRLNYYKNGDKMMSGAVAKDFTLENITDQLLTSSEYTARVKSIADFNQANRWRKRGLDVVPIRFPCSWLGGNFNCLIAIFHGDGTIAVTHGGVEMGQGINTKVAQVVAFELGVDMKYIIIQPTQAITNANARGTNGSVGSELVCLAAIDCCRQLKNRIDVVRQKSPKKSWEGIIAECFTTGVDLSARSWVNPFTPDPVVYTTYGAMCTEVELDVLTGESQITRLDILYDCGESMSPFVDIGQVEGAIVMGLGYFTTENQIYDAKTGENLSYGTWKYKPPMAKDIPIDFRIALLQNAPNPTGVLRSKFVAEPPLCMTSSVVFALRDAIAANLAESKKDTWFPIVTPMTVERNQQYCQLDISQLRYKD